jgi:hypothetical protein
MRASEGEVPPLLARNTLHKIVNLRLPDAPALFLASTATFPCDRLPHGGPMRRQLKNFLPIVLVALLVQIFAPIGACWAASFAASDPIAGAVICHDGATDGAQDNQTGHRAHDGCCAVCSVLQTGAPIDTPQISIAIVIDRPTSQVAWLDFALGLSGSRTASEARARAPPFLS